MSTSRTKLLASLRQLQKKRRLLLRILTQEHELAVGSVSTVRGKCGKPNCRCAHGEGHPQVVFLFRGDDRRRRCKLIRQNDAKRMLLAGDRYRKCRQALKQLRAIQKEEEQILMALINERAIEYK